MLKSICLVIIRSTYKMIPIAIFLFYIGLSFLTLMFSPNKDRIMEEYHSSGRMITSEDILRNKDIYLSLEHCQSVHQLHAITSILIILALLVVIFKMKQSNN